MAKKKSRKSVDFFLVGDWVKLKHTKKKAKVIAVKRLIERRNGATYEIDSYVYLDRKLDGLDCWEVRYLKKCKKDK